MTSGVAIVGCWYLLGAASQCGGGKKGLRQQNTMKKLEFNAMKLVCVRPRSYTLVYILWKVALIQDASELFKSFLGKKRCVLYAGNYGNWFNAMKLFVRSLARKKSPVTKRNISRVISVKEKIEEEDRKKGMTKDKLIEEEMAAVGSVSPFSFDTWRGKSLFVMPRGRCSFPHIPNSLTSSDKN